MGRGLSPAVAEPTNVVLSHFLLPSALLKALALVVCTSCLFFFGFALLVCLKTATFACSFIVGLREPVHLNPVIFC